MTTINGMATVLIGLNGEPIKHIDMHGVTIDLTFAEAVCLALNSIQPNQNISAEEKLARFDLMHRLYNNAIQPIFLSSTDVELIKDACGRFWSPLIFGLIHKLLN